MTGSIIPLRKNVMINDPDGAHPINIWIGHHEVAERWNVDLGDLDSDGFAIIFRDTDDILILGPSDWGTEFGIYAFLEEYVGIHWLMPGIDGEHIPKLSDLDIKIQDMRQSPVFISRLLFGLDNPTVSLWARRNRMHSRFRFHHNMYNLFPPGKIRATHPQFLPQKRKTGDFPAQGQFSGWQPCFLSPGIDTYAINEITSYFTMHPNEVSYSLGINDGKSDYRCANDPKLFTINYLDHKNWSDVFFNWANRVAEGVSIKYPNKWLGCLAYNTLAEPPESTVIHPQIIPFITSDRLKWVDPLQREKEIKIHNRWRQTGALLGWYDYIYGTPYLIPRIYFDVMADNYRFASDNGVVAMVAEAYPNWGEGPKMYLTLKLWWNPNQDVETLLNDWYRLAVGPQAAEDLSRFFAFWNEIWTKRIPKTKWFNVNKTYLVFNAPQYLDALTYADLDLAKGLLDEVVAKAQTSVQKKRAQIIAKAFDYYYASAMAYLGLILKRPLPGHDETSFQAYDRQRKVLSDAFEKDPVLRHPLRYDIPKLEQLAF